MRFQTRHVGSVDVRGGAKVPVVFICNDSTRIAANKPAPVIGEFWTPTTPVQINDTLWSVTKSELRVRIPLYRYFVPSHPTMLAASMLELGVLARNSLPKCRDGDPDVCHIFASDISILNDGEAEYAVHVGFSFEFGINDGV